MVGCDVDIRLDRQDGIGLRPAMGRLPPDTREIEPVTVLERETEVPRPTAMAKLGCRHQTAVVGWKRPSFRADDIGRAWAAIEPTQPPGQLHHLHMAVMPSYDDAALVERGVGLENLRVHHM